MSDITMRPDHRLDPRSPLYQAVHRICEHFYLHRANINDISAIRKSSSDAVEAILHETLLNASPRWSIETDSDGHFQMHVTHWATKLLAASMADTLGDAPNYVTMELWHTSGPLHVTIQRSGGKSPAQNLAEMDTIIRALVDSAPGALETARKWLAEREKLDAAAARLEAAEKRQEKRWPWWRRALMRLANYRG